MCIEFAGKLGDIWRPLLRGTYNPGQPVALEAIDALTIRGGPDPFPHYCTRFAKRWDGAQMNATRLGMRMAKFLKEIAPANRPVRP